MDVYRETILDHYKNPRNYGHLKNPDALHQEYNSACGDRITMEVNITHFSSGPVLSDIRFSGEGCAISMASASMLTEKARGMSMKQCLNMDTDTVLAMLHTSLTPSRIKCATLPLEVLHKTLRKSMQAKKKT